MASDTAPMSPAVDRLLTMLATGQRRILVALAGLPGSGKSTVAQRWAADVARLAGPGRLQVIGMDGFHLPRAALARMPDPAAALARRGAPWTFDAAALRERIAALRGTAGGTLPDVPWPDFQHDVGDPVDGAITVPRATQLVLVEGLYLLHHGDGWDLAGLFDERWFLDVAPDQALRQLSARHQRAWGLTAAEAQERIAANDGLNAGLVWADRAHADWLAPSV
jgi:pantothenate kinase